MMDTNSTVKPTDLRHDEKAARILDLVLEDGNNIHCAEGGGCIQITPILLVVIGEDRPCCSQSVCLCFTLVCCGLASPNCSTSVSLG
jgi:hypothetical protein